MRSAAINIAGACAAFMLGTAGVRAAVLTNVDFETGNLGGWTASANQLTIQASTNDSFNRSYAARLAGNYTSVNYITNSLSQTFAFTKGDTLSLEGFMRWKSYSEQNAAGTGYVRAALIGSYGYTNATYQSFWGATNDWVYFNLSTPTFGIKNGGFEVSNLTDWAVACDNLTAFDTTNFSASGGHSMRMVGSWTNWSFNQAYQVVDLQVGDVVSAKAKMRVDSLQTTGPWIVAGIKLERDFGGQSTQDVREANFNSATQFVDLACSMVCTQAGAYVYRCMVLGGDPGVSTADVYFDDVSITTTGTVQNATLELSYIGHSGAAGATSSVEVLFDAFTLRGSRAGIVPSTNILTTLTFEAQTIGTNSGLPIAAVPYAPLTSYGQPSTGFYPASVEVAFGGLSFKGLSNSVNTPISCNFTIYPDTNGQGYLELDRFQFLAADPNVARGLSYTYLTNSPYFALGTDDNKSTEFGTGPFPASYTYVQGTSLTNFPRRMSTDPNNGQWP
ncbi:MAG TPA: hypothetical protein VIH35_02090, partial [Kiritimatiellia bacterium]